MSGVNNEHLRPHDQPAAEVSPWSRLRVLTYSIIIALVWLGSALIIMMLLGAAMLIREVAGAPDVDVAQSIERLGSNDLLISLGATGSVLLSTPFVGYLVQRRESEPWAFLGFTHAKVRAVLVWSLAAVALLAVTDLLRVAIGIPLVPVVTIEEYSSLTYRLPFFVIVIVVGPFFEELFFRGFLAGTLRAAGDSAIIAAVVSSTAWCAIHIQYDLVDAASLFPAGLLLAVARFRTGSILPCVAMHALTNVVAAIELVVVADSASF